MGDVRIRLSMDEPSPPDADFVFKIDFQRGSGDPGRVFRAAQSLIEGLERLDDELVKSIDSSIRPVLVLEDIEGGSIKVFLRNLVSAVDDDALKTLDWKPAVGAYLVKAKYAIIAWSNRPDAPAALADLRSDIQMIAQQTDVRRLEDYAPPAPAALVRALGDIQSAKAHLSAGDSMTVTADGRTLDVDLSLSFSAETIEALAVSRVIDQPGVEMILQVKKPDFLGTSQWELRHGRRTISATISDAEWLGRFQSRQEDVRPGDALRCNVAMSLLYGHDNELIAERYTVVEVMEVLRDRTHQSDMF